MAPGHRCFSAAKEEKELRKKNELEEQTVWKALNVYLSLPNLCVSLKVILKSQAELKPTQKTVNIGQYGFSPFASAKNCMSCIMLRGSAKHS